MLKFRAFRVSFCLFILVSVALAGGVIKLVNADSGSPWLNSPLYLNKVMDVDATNIPSTLWETGNVDCAVIFNGKCSIDTAYGSVSGSSMWLDGQWRPIKDYSGNSSNFFAVPNSDTGITTSSPSGFGSYVYFTDIISESLSPHYLVGSSGLDVSLNYFQLNRTYDRKLADKTGNRLAADLNSLAFSGNSQWIVVTSPNIANLRVNISNGEVLPFGRTLTYGYGQNPIPKSAITSDGRYSLEATRDASTFSIYDLSTCGQVPDTISRPVGCASRELINNLFLSSNIPGYSGTVYARFLDDNTLSFYASYKQGNVAKLALYTLTTNPDAARQLQYLALGDSYISGEGAYDYAGGTDTKTNHCHLSNASYPYLLGYDLRYDSYHSVACSGAVTADVTDTAMPNGNKGPQALGKEDSSYDGQIYTSFEPGYRPQINFVKRYQPAVITLSIGGNDMGFSTVLVRCLEPDTCYSTYEDRVELVRQINETVFPRLVNTYQQLKDASPNSKIYPVGYPQIVKPDGDCGLNVHLNAQETEFSQQLIDYLDQVIEAAANKVGVKYIDSQDALAGYRLCEGRPGSIAVNGITAGDDRVFNTIGAESYHPNAFGHSLLEQSIISSSNALTKPMLPPNPGSIFPSEDGLAILEVAHSGRQINILNFNNDLSDNVVYRGGAWKITVQSGKFLLKAGSKVKIVLNSNPTDLGEFDTGQNGELNAQVNSTADVPAGFHILHVYGIDPANRPVDIYKGIYVADSPQSMTATTDNPCVIVPAADQDYDQDGIDDACDGDIGSAPVITNGAVETSSAQASSSTGFVNQVVSILTSNLQNQTGPYKITTADSWSTDNTAPAVLAAETSEPNKINQTISNNKDGIEYLPAAAGIAGVMGLGYVLLRKVW